MDYTIALELKTAGFPQYEDAVLASEDISGKTAYNRRDHRTFDLSLLGYPRTEPDYYTQGKFRPSCIFNRQYLQSEEGKEETVYFPPLIELIEACDEQFIELIKEKSGWSATFDEDGNMPVAIEGKTPEEAVAKLWLALNKK